jgi:hypothetical protein
MPRQLLILAAAALLVITCVARAWADPLADEMTTMNARWDAAINNADFDALLPMYTADARLMPPGAQPVTGPTAIRNFFAGREEASVSTNLSWLMSCQSRTTPMSHRISRPR